MKVVEDTILNIIEQIKKKEVIVTKGLISLLRKFSSVRKEELSKLPYHINLLSCLTRHDLHETSHSSILNKFLQNENLLFSFLRRFYGDFIDQIKTSDIRIPESDRMDLSIFSKNKCFIIENKINNAPETDGQIFKYVEIAHRYGYRFSDIIVIYINSNYRDYPTNKSLSKDGKEEVFIDEEIKKNMILLDFSHDIHNWLKDELKLLENSNETYLFTSLYQYADFLETKFQKSKRFDNMKKEIIKLINDNFLSGYSNLTDPEYEERIDLLNQLEEEISAFQEEISDYKWDLQRKKDRREIEKKLKVLGLALIDMSSEQYDEENYGIKFTKNGIPGYIAFGYDSYEGRQYVGFASNTSLLGESYKEQLSKFITSLGLQPEIQEPVWIAWAYIKNNTTLPQVFLNLIEKVIHTAKNHSYKIRVGEL